MDIGNVAVGNGFGILVNDYEAVVGKVELCKELGVDFLDDESFFDGEFFPHVELYLIVLIVVSLNFYDLGIVFRLFQRLIERLFLVV